MEQIVFEGQQTDEKILYTIFPNLLARNIAIIRNVVLAIILFVILFLIGSVAGPLSMLLQFGGILLSLAVVVGGTAWNLMAYSKTVSYITDRRIMRFEMVTPFLRTKRSLFWNEALKAKGFAPNLIYKYFKIGNIYIEPHLADHENVRITDVYYYEDLVNYIDKILFTFKNHPEQITEIKPFIPKPRGQRG
jgi:hypothetical protein